MDAAIQFSERMAKANLLPAHLKSSPSDCLRVVLQAARWQMDPFSVADKTSVISGKLMYEGQLVSAVVNARGKLSKRLDYQYTGEGANRVLTVSGTLQGEEQPRTITLTHALASKINRNGQMGINPDQQMAYIGARIWARRHTPELMLGVYVPDEIEVDDNGEMKNVTETPPERPDPSTVKRGPGRPPKGAAAAAKPEEPAKPAESPAIDIAATPAAETPREAEKPADPVAATALKKGEKRTVTVQIVHAQYEDFAGSDGAIITVSGQYVGKLYDLSGGMKHTSGPMAKPVWAVGKTVTVDILGRNSKALGVIAIVEKVTPAEEADLP
jgi:hypothetical protein